MSLDNIIHLIFSDFKPKQLKKSKDWNGFLLIVYTLVVITLLPFFPLLIVLLELDPFNHVFELILPSPYERNLQVIVIVPLIRILLCTVCYFEYVRFGFLLIFFSLCSACTALNYLNKLTFQNRSFQNVTLRLYNQLRIILKVSEYFLCNVVLLLMFCSQVLLTSIWWICIVCWEFLPGLVSFSVFLLAFLCTSILILLLPRAVEISDVSEQLVKTKKAMYHTYHKLGKSRCQYLQWLAQQILPIRCSFLFLVNKNTPMDYYTVLISNLTNAILLVNP